MITVTGTYGRSLFRNEQNGYTVFTFNSKNWDEYKDKNGNLICCGYVMGYSKGMPLIIEGTPKESKGNITIEVSSIHEYSDEISISISYLSSGTFKGIGEKTAKKILDVTGPDIFGFINKPDAADILSDNISELKNGKALAFIETIKKTIFLKSIFDYIYKFGGSYSEASALFSKYGLNSLEKLKENPYKIGFEVDIPFSVCDSIAKSLDFHEFNFQRVMALIATAMKYIANCGNTYAELKDIYKVVSKISMESVYMCEIPPVILMNSLVRMKSIKTCPSSGLTRFYLKSLWMAEEKIVSELMRLTQSAVELNFTPEIIEEIEKIYNIKYSTSQKKCFDFLKSTGIKILTGGPGTGKTTVIKGLIDAYKKNNPGKIVTLCAPTGRAAQRITESTGLEASTIHRLLNFRPYGSGDDYTCKDQSDPIVADMLIVDEMSMTDTELFSLLLGAVPNGTLVILCGDIDQLPSVGPGNVLKDIISSGKFEVNTLNTIYRQSEDSNIIRNAININNGYTNIKTGGDFELINVNTSEEVMEEVVKTVRKYKNTDKDYIQVLCPSKKGESGTIKLNQTIQKIYNSKEEGIVYGFNRFKPGDKIMTIKNNYKLNYFNGDVGTVVAVDSGKIVIKINNEEIEMTNDLLNDLVLAYASTIHKSQGSEYPVVIIALPEEPHTMLKRNLLYTAVTRAKNKVVIISEGGSLKTAINRRDNFSRKTTLKDKLCTRFSET